MFPSTPSSATVDYILATSLIGGAWAFHVDMAIINSWVAFVGGVLGVALGASRLYFFFKEKRDEHSKMDEGS
jgi:putative Mn2+ efflux pump MntP